MQEFMATEPFSGEPETKWLTQAPQTEDRCMTLLESFWFRDPDDGDKQWDAPKGMTTDGASIPRALWTLIGSPYTGNYRRAAIVHDRACDLADNDSTKRSEADRMFYHACRAGRCSIWDATILYIGVRIGAAATLVKEWQPALALRLTPRLARTFAEDRLETDFRAVAQSVLSEGETDDVFEIERRTDRALSLVAGLKFKRRSQHTRGRNKRGIRRR